MNNSDLPIRLGTLIGAHTATWVAESQPVEWRPDTWRRYWRKNRLPCSHVLDELAAEYSSQGTIRRKFILDTYQDRPAADLFVAARAWGTGPDNRGPAKTGGILTQPQAGAKIDDMVSVVRQGGAAAGYRAYYARNRLENLDVAFVTKLLYFAGYRSSHRPRPLIYDSRVAAAAARFTSAPLLPLIADGVTTSSYQRYCEWAEDIARQHQTEPAVIEWALFALGAEIRTKLVCSAPLSDHLPELDPLVQLARHQRGRAMAGQWESFAERVGTFSSEPSRERWPGLAGQVLEESRATCCGRTCRSLGPQLL